MAEGGSANDDSECRKYLNEHKIPELLQALTVGLIRHRPDDPVDFLLSCLEEAKNFSPDQVTWDAFLGRNSLLRRESTHNNPKTNHNINGILPLPDITSINLNADESVPVEKVPTESQVAERTISAEAEREDLESPLASSSSNDIMASAAKRRRLMKERYSASPTNSTTTMTTSTDGVDFAGRRINMAEEIAEGVPKPPLLAVTGRQNTMLEFESLFTASDSIENEESNDDVASDEDQARKSPSRRGPVVDPKTMQVLQGSFKELPPRPTSTVRIFLSSTFSDFKAERNMLPRLAYPKLQQHCSQEGLDFQVVDMRWGVTDDVINDHQVSQLCINEIVTCQQISCGPNFVALLGNRYGFQPFPAKIGYEEFENLLKIAEETNSEDSALLTEWFIKDENVVPPEYILQSIPSKLPYYDNNEEENEERRDQDRNTWQEISDKLRQVLRDAARIAKDKGLITAEKEHTYHISVTEEEVGQGIFRSDSPDEKVLCYQRSLEGLVSDEIDDDVPKYIDLDGEMKVDKGAEKLRNELLQEKIPRVVSQENIRTYDVAWKGKALEKARKETEYDDYIQNFCEDFVRDMIKLVDKNVTQIKKQRKGEVDGLYEEVLHHSQFAKAKCELFCGREAEIETIKNYLQSKDAKERHPFVVHTKSGYGKTALMAYVSSHIHEWLGDTSVVVLRFLGTSPQSSSIISLLRSIIQQICIVYGFKVPADDVLEMFSDVRRCLWSVLKNTKNAAPDRPLILVLDAVDQLQASYGAHEFLWLMRTLPSNVYIIVSMLSDKFHLVENAKARLGEETLFLELPELPESTGADIVQCYLKSHNRMVTDDQYKLILSAFDKNRQALFLKLILDTARTWNSYTSVDSIRLAATVHDAIMALYGVLENNYGKVFVQNALGYLTCGRGGLSPLEMEDILSCDNACMSEIYQYHDPPLQGVVRIPSLMWSRVQHALQEYLTERQVDGKSVMAWYHRQFHETAEKRFLKPDCRRQELHFALSELFMQEDGITKTVILHRRNGKVIENADRCVSPQPLNVRNKRKLHALPYHLLHSIRKEPLKECCLLNFEFLLIKLKALNIGALLNEYRELAECELLAEEEDIKLFLDFLQLCYNALTYDPNLFAFHVKESLKNCCQEYPLLQKLVQDAENWIEMSNAPLLLPVNVFKLEPADSPLKFSIFIGYDGFLTKDEEHMVCCWAESISKVFKVNCINLKTNDIVASVTTEKPTPVAITNDDKRFIFGEATTMRICEISSGDQIKRFPHLKKQYDKVTIRNIALSRNGKYCAVAIRCGRPKDLKGDKWRQTTFIALIDLEIYSTTAEIEYPGRKHPDKMYFINDDSQLLVSAKDKLTIVDLSNFERTQVNMPFAVNSQAQRIIEDQHLLIFGISSGNVAKVCVYNYKDSSIEYSKHVHMSEQDKVEPFGLCAKDDASVVLIGTAVNTKEAYDESVCLWDRKEDKYTIIPLSHQPFKTPCSLQVTPDWSYGLVGWNNGHLAIVDLQNNKEIYIYHAHAHAIYNITFLDQGRHFITMSQDHCLKLWNSKRQIKKYLAECQASQGEVVSSQDAETGRSLDEKEESLQIDGSDRHVVTAISDHSKGPQMWNLGDGTLNATLTKKLQEVYEKSMENHNPDAGSVSDKVHSLNDPTSGKTHGSVFLLPNDILIYERKRRDFIATWTFRIRDGENPLVLGQYAEAPAFLRVVGPELDGKPQKYLVVKDGELQILSFPGLEKQHTVEIPKITDEIPNINSSGGKKKLMYYRAGVTIDGKYFVLANPTLSRSFRASASAAADTASSGKFFDLVDLEENKYMGRHELSRFVPWTLMEDGCCFLADVQEEGLGLYSPSKLVMLKKSAIKSKTLLNLDKFLSPDRSLGFELKDHSIYVWQLDTIKRLYVLSGHVHEVTSLSVTNDNQYLASGSYDNTARIWSLSAGIQLCMFHTYGAIDTVVLTPSVSHLIVQCYAAPQRKRGLVLEIKNL